jgi:chromosome segregation ATPase
MQEQEKMVDIDTSGPGADIELEEQKQEDIVETKEEDSSSAPQAAESTDEKVEEKQEASDEKQETKEQKDELKDYSEGVQRRIAKLTKKWREAQRQADEALTYAKVQKEEREKLQKKYSSVEQAGVKDREERIKAGMQAAAAKLAAAREQQDFAAEIEAQKEIARLGYEEARLVESKQMAEEVEKVAPKEQELPRISPQQTEQTDPKAEAWGSKNRWFGTDTAMTYTAFDLHKKLTEEEGYDPSSDEYYAEIDKRIRLEFPHKFDTNTTKAENVTTKPTQIVASATRSVKPGRKTVRLTPSQVAIAKKLGVPLEEYAKQLKLTKEV